VPVARPVAVGSLAGNVISTASSTLRSHACGSSRFISTSTALRAPSTASRRGIGEAAAAEPCRDWGRLRAISLTLRPRHSAACLRVLAAGLGDTAERLDGGPVLAARLSDVAEGENAHEPLVAIDHGQPPNLDVGHVDGNVVDVLVVEAVADIGAH